MRYTVTIIYSIKLFMIQELYSYNISENKPQISPTESGYGIEFVNTKIIRKFLTVRSVLHVACRFEYKFALTPFFPQYRFIDVSF